MQSHLLPPPTVSGQVDSRGRILMPANAWQTEEQRAALATYAIPHHQPPQVGNGSAWLHNLSLLVTRVRGVGGSHLNDN